jgi:hypothetical protein
LIDNISHGQQAQVSLLRNDQMKNFKWKMGNLALVPPLFTILSPWAKLFAILSKTKGLPVVFATGTSFRKSIDGDWVAYAESPPAPCSRVLPETY